MPAFAHTPYDGSAKPFAIGLARLDLAHWIEPDEHLARHLAEKEQRLATRRDDMFREEEGSRDGQAEVLALLADHLPRQFPGLYERRGPTILLRPANRQIVLAAADAPLVTAARLVQEDLCLMRRGPDGYRLVAGAVCFPSAWSVADKIGRKLIDIHAPVPGYATQLAARVDTIFANLRADLPLWRINWSIYPDADLHHPAPKPRPRNWFASAATSSAWLRIERQTLRRMPASGDILFTIKVVLDPFDDLRRHPEGPRLAASLKAQILALNEDQLAYKSMLAHRDRMVAALDDIAASYSTPSNLI
jgi:hypothetical protein